MNNMDLSTVLARFERDPSEWEKILKDEAKRDCSSIAMSLCTISRPTVQNNARPVSDSIRLLSLVSLQQLVEKHWTLSPSYLKRMKPTSNVVPRVADETKGSIMETLLGDVALEKNLACARKRAQCIASIARYDWMQWNSLFPSLATAMNAPVATQYLHALTLHRVLKELASTQRVGHQAAVLQKVAAEIYPKLFHQMSLIFRRTVNFEAMPDEDADLAACIAKSINELIRGSPSVADLVLGPHFEVVLASLSLRPSTPSTARLLWALRKTCLVSMRSHPVMFGDLFLGVFAERTAQALQSSAGTIASDQPEAELLIFCFAFWTELISQKAYRRSTVESLDRSLPVVARQALARLRLSEEDIEQWRTCGGEHFCAEDDGEGEVSLVQSWKEDSVRRAARRFLQACFDQPLPERANTILAEIFGTPYVDPLAIEAAFLAVQLSAARLHGTWNFDEFLKSRLLPCFSVLHSPIDACIARRACLVIRAWVFDLGPESIGLVISTLAQVISHPDCDLGVAIAAIDCIQGLVNDAPVSAASKMTMEMVHAMVAPLLTQRALCNLVARFELPDSRCRVLFLMETLMLIVRDASAASDVLAELVPIALAKEGKGLVERAAIDLAGTCVQSAGFSMLKPQARNICLDLVALACVNHNPALDDSWPRLLLLCLRTADSCESVRPLLDRNTLQSIPQPRLQCEAVEACARLWRQDMVLGRSPPVPDVSFALWAFTQRFISGQERFNDSVLESTSNTATTGTRDGGVIAREDPDDPFEMLHICRCLDMLVRTGLAHMLVTSPLSSSSSASATVAMKMKTSSIVNSPLLNPVQPPNIGIGRTATSRPSPPPLNLASSPPPQTSSANRVPVLQAHKPPVTAFSAEVGELNSSSSSSSSSSVEDVRMLNKECWVRIVNSSILELAVEEQCDSRDVIERITLVARVLLSQLATFASVSSASSFASLCLKYIDAVGYAPSEAAWRRRLWASALLLTLSMCRELGETRQILPCAVQACAIVVRTQEESGPPEPPCFSAVDEDELQAEIDLDRQRKERLFLDDEFIATNIKQAFAKVWQMLVTRFGSDELAKLVQLISPLGADHHHGADKKQSTMGLNNRSAPTTADGACLGPAHLPSAFDNEALAILLS